MIESFTWKTIRVIIVFTLSIAIWPVISGAMMLVTGMSSNWALVIGLLVFCWVFPTFLLKNVIIVPESNTGIVLQNLLLPSKESDEARINVDPEAIPRGQRAVYSGLNIKYPWEVPLGKPVSMVTEVPAVNIFVVTDQDGKRWNVTTTVPLTPLGGKYLPRYLRAGDDAAKAYFGSAAENCVRAMLAENPGKEFAKKIREKSKPFFDAVFGGLDTTDDEKRYGRFTNEPFISSITPFEQDQIYDQVAGRVEQIKRSFEALAGPGAVMDPKSAANAVAAASGEEVRYLHITGLENGGYVSLGESFFGPKDKDKDKGKGGKPKP